MAWIDITRPLHAGMPVWPGDTPFSFELSWTKEQSGSVNVGRWVMSSHTGTHVDAPFHFDEAGKKMHEVDLSLYAGPALVVRLPERGSIGASDLEGKVPDGTERLLIRTDSWKDPSVFPETFTFIRPDAAPFLAKKGVRLLGLDVPSVDPVDSKSLDAHHSLHRFGIHLLESTDLSRVEEGEYELFAFPLRVEGGDGSPVRAVLRKK
ncbi:arylformamidase [Staphylospora marina]|uniref:arylformamidase n=1 Tax=Staphylospora marina TaxID=2490858 RepID=UPI000F5B8A0C|nr:arylformamidase [Staphylospora marina]